MKRNDDFIQEKVKKVFTADVPDVYASVLSDVKNQKGQVRTMKRKSTSRKTGLIAAMAVCLVAVFALVLGITMFGGESKASAIVSLDVNPSIQIEVDENGKVIKVQAMNDDAAEIIGTMDLSGSTLEVAVNAIVGAMVRAGKLSEIQNSILLSVNAKNAELEKQISDRLTAEVNKAMQESGEVLTVKINAAVNAGVISYVKGVRGFIPASLLSIAYVEDLNEWVDKSIEVKVITVDPEEKRLVLSGKAVEQEKAAAERAAKMDAVNVGDIYDGKVERITSFGAFVGFADDLSGLVHISQMANKHIESPNEVVKVGDEVKVKVIGKKDGKISLSMKAALDADAEVVDNREPAFNYKEEGQAATSLASLLAGIKLD